MPLNVNREVLEKIHGKGQKAEEAFREIADLGGFGEVGTGQGQLNIDYAGGLGILGVLKEENTAITPQAKDRIAELAGVDRKKDIDGHVPSAIPMKNK